MMMGPSPASPCLPSTPNLGVGQPGGKCSHPPLELGPFQVHVGSTELSGFWTKLSKIHTWFPWQSCLSLLSQLQREVKVLPRTTPNQSPSNFWACPLNPAMLAVLPLSSSTHFLLVPLRRFLWVCQKGEEIFLSLVCFTPLLPSVHPSP